MSKASKNTGKDDPGRLFAEQLIERMKEINASDWKQGWIDAKSNGGIPQNIDGRRYNGANPFFLMVNTAKNKYTVPVYATFLRISKLNDHLLDENGRIPKDKSDQCVRIKKGEHSIPVLYWSFSIKDKDGHKISMEEYDLLTKEEQDKYTVMPIPRTYSVFNIDQTNLAEVDKERYQAIVDKVKGTSLTDTAGMYANAALDRMFAKQEWVCPIHVDEAQSDCFYRTSEDAIYGPMKGQFKIHNEKEPEELYKDGMEFYSSIVHEMAHSTGTAERLNRQKGSRFGDPKYGKEELVAELTAALVGSTLGFDKRIRDNNTAYVKGWLNALHEEPKFIYTIMSEVGKASDMILAEVEKQEKKIEAKQGKSETQEVKTDEKAEQVKEDKVQAAMQHTDENQRADVHAAKQMPEQQNDTDNEKSIVNLVDGEDSTYYYFFYKFPVLGAKKPSELVGETFFLDDDRQKPLVIVGYDKTKDQFTVSEKDADGKDVTKQMSSDNLVDYLFYHFTSQAQNKVNDLAVERMKAQKAVEESQPLRYHNGKWLGVPAAVAVSDLIPKRGREPYSYLKNGNDRIDLIKLQDDLGVARVYISDNHAETPAAIIKELEKEGFSREIKGNGYSDGFVDFDNFKEANAFASHVDDIQKRVDAERASRTMDVKPAINPKELTDAEVKDFREGLQDTVRRMKNEGDSDLSINNYLDDLKVKWEESPAMLAAISDAGKMILEEEKKDWYVSVNYLQSSEDTAVFEEFEAKDDYKGMLQEARNYDFSAENDWDLQATFKGSPKHYSGDDIMDEDEDYAVVKNDSVGGSYTIFRRATESEVRDEAIRQGFGEEKIGDYDNRLSDDMKELVNQMVDEKQKVVPQSENVKSSQEPAKDWYIPTSLDISDDVVSHLSELEKQHDYKGMLKYACEHESGPVKSFIFGNSYKNNPAQETGEVLLSEDDKFALVRDTFHENKWCYSLYQKLTENEMRKQLTDNGYGNEKLDKGDLDDFSRDAWNLVNKMAEEKPQSKQQEIDKIFSKLTEAGSELQRNYYDHENFFDKTWYGNHLGMDNVNGIVSSLSYEYSFINNVGPEGNKAKAAFNEDFKDAYRYFSELRWIADCKGYGYGAAARGFSPSAPLGIMWSESYNAQRQLDRLNDILGLNFDLNKLYNEGIEKSRTDLAKAHALDNDPEVEILKHMPETDDSLKQEKLYDVFGMKDGNRETIKTGLTMEASAKFVERNDQRYQRKGYDYLISMPQEENRPQGKPDKKARWEAILKSSKEKKPVSLSEKKIKERQEKFAVEKGKAGTIYTGDYAEALKSSNTPEEAIAKLSEMADGCISEYKKWAAKSYKDTKEGVNVGDELDGSFKTYTSINNRRKRNNMNGALESVSDIKDDVRVLMERVGYPESEIKRALQAIDEKIAAAKQQRTESSARTGTKGVNGSDDSTLIDIQEKYAKLEGMYYYDDLHEKYVKLGKLSCDESIFPHNGYNTVYGRVNAWAMMRDFHEGKLKTEEQVQKLEKIDAVTIESSSRKVPTIQEYFADNKLENGQTVDKLTVYKQNDKSIFYTEVGNLKMSREASKEDLKAFFDRTTPVSDIVTKNFGEQLHLASFYNQFKLAEGVADVNLKHAADGNWYVQAKLTDGRTTDSHVLSWHDRQSLFTIHAATKEQLAARYLNPVIMKMVAEKPVKEQADIQNVSGNMKDAQNVQNTKKWYWDLPGSVELIIPSADFKNGEKELLQAVNKAYSDDLSDIDLQDVHYNLPIGTNRKNMENNMASLLVEDVDAHPLKSYSTLAEDDKFVIVGDTQSKDIRAYRKLSEAEVVKALTEYAKNNDINIAPMDKELQKLASKMNLQKVRSEKEHMDNQNSTTKSDIEKQQEIQDTMEIMKEKEAKQKAAEAQKEAQQQKEQNEKQKQAQEQAQQQQQRQQKEHEKKDKSQKPVSAAVVQSALIVTALEYAKANDGRFLNPEGKSEPQIINSKTSLTPYNQAILSMKSDQEGWRTNAYTFMKPAADAGMPVRKGEKATPANWVQWSYKNTQTGEIIDSKKFKDVPESDRDLYERVHDRKSYPLFNVDQTVMNAKKHEEYINLVTSKGQTLETIRDFKHDDRAKRTEELMARLPHSVVLYKDGDTIKAYGGSAKKLQNILSESKGFNITDIKNESGKKVLVASFPESRLAGNLKAINAKGERISFLEYKDLATFIKKPLDKSDVIKSVLQDVNKAAQGSGIKVERVLKETPTEYDAAKDTITYSGISKDDGTLRSVSATLDKANDLYRSLVDAFNSKSRLDASHRVNMTPEDAAAHVALVRDMAAGVLMTRNGLPSSLSVDTMISIDHLINELKENPNKVNLLERGVNTAIEVIDKAKLGREIDYGKIRGEKSALADTNSMNFSIIRNLQSMPDKDSREIVVIRDRTSSKADVILPQGASLEASKELPGISKSRIANALSKEGFNDVKFYNARGGLGLQQPNSYFEGKEVTLSKLKQYDLLTKKELDVSSSISKSNDKVIDKFRPLKDDAGIYVFYIKPENEKGFGIKPSGKDMTEYYNAVRSKDKQAIYAVVDELSQKYYQMASNHPELKRDFIMPDTSRIDFAKVKIENATLTRDTADNQVYLQARVNGKFMREPVTKQQWDRMWLADDMQAYKNAVAAVTFVPKLDEKQAQSTEKSQQANVGTSESESVKSTQPEQPSEDKSKDKSETNSLGEGTGPSADDSKSSIPEQTEKDNDQEEDVEEGVRSGRRL